jgi:hypothetical protein
VRVIDLSDVKVAILDGEFDLNHASGELVFSDPHLNVTDDTTNVGVSNNDAHGTLCAGIVGAGDAIAEWPGGGVASGVAMIPVSVYRTEESAPDAQLQDLVDGIGAAVDEQIAVISISLSGFPPASSLIDAIENAERNQAVIVAGTGNRTTDEADRADFVQYPARFATVLGVGAATLDESGGQRSLNRVSTLSSLDALEPLAWESRYGLGLDVVARGLGVTSTDISDTGGANNVGSPQGDIWRKFSGTSAATPVVAGFAALIAGSGIRSPIAIRHQVRLAARQIGPERYTRERNGIWWNRRVGFGWIDSEVVEQWIAGNEVEEVETEGDEAMSDSGNVSESNVPCEVDEELSEFVGIEGYEFAGMFNDALRPVSDFLNALGSTDAMCCTMAARFWQDPYRTARIAGLPWHAAILLGQGDWPAVYRAVDVELHRVENPGGPGPIWVRAR